MLTLGVAITTLEAVLSGVTSFEAVVIEEASFSLASLRFPEALESDEGSFTTFFPRFRRRFSLGNLQCWLATTGVL